MNETVPYDVCIFSHQGSCTKRMSNGGFWLLAIAFIAACVAAFDLLTFRLHIASEVFGLACLCIKGV